MIEIVEANASHVGDIILGMREHDLGEFNVVGTDPRKMILESLEKSARSWTALLDGTAVCMWGVREESVLGGGHIWLITTKAVDEFPLDFLRLSFKSVRETLSEFKFLYGYVEDNYALSHRWMKWLGFRPVSFSDLGPIKLHRYELSHGN